MSGSDSARMYEQVAVCARLVQKWGGAWPHLRARLVSSRNQACSAQVAAPRNQTRRMPLSAAGVVNVILLCSGAILVGCDSQAQERAEARDLLAKLNAISDESSLSERHSALDALAKLRLRAPAHIAMRDACRAAHQELLEAETAQVSARKALAAVSRDPSGGTLSPSQARAIAADIEQSNRALAEAKGRFPTCERAMRELTTKAH